MFNQKKAGKEALKMTPKVPDLRIGEKFTDMGKTRGKMWIF